MNACISTQLIKLKQLRVYCAVEFLSPPAFLIGMWLCLCGSLKLFCAQNFNKGSFSLKKNVSIEFSNLCATTCRMRKYEVR